jgi:hypothetical protein
MAGYLQNLRLKLAIKMLSQKDGRPTMHELSGYVVNNAILLTACHFYLIFNIDTLIKSQLQFRAKVPTTSHLET